LVDDLLKEGCVFSFGIIISVVIITEVNMITNIVKIGVAVGIALLG
jgi:hypothetical protein